MTSSLCPLGDDCGGAGLNRLVDVSQRLHLADQFGATPGNLFSERPWVAEGEKYAIGRITEHLIEHVGNARKCPGDKADTEPLPMDMREFLHEIRFTAKDTGVTSTDDSEPSSAPRRASL